MKNYLKNITIGALAMIVVASPLIGFAKENENRGKGSNNSQAQKVQIHDNDKDERNKKNENKKDDKKTIPANSCMRAYGHFFAFGWNKKNENCRFPFGINKKFHGYNATTTPDVTAPVISNVTSNPNKVQADIRWSTNEYTDGIVFWGTSSSVDTSDSANKTANTRLAKNHQVLLRNLTPDTTYYFIVRSKDVAGNQSLSSVASFKTKVASTTDTQFPVISSVVTGVSTSTINVGWKTNENTTDRVFYSTTLPVTINASSTAYVSNASTTKTHALSIIGLNANTTYYLVIESTDAAGNITTSATFSAKTISLPPLADVTSPVLSSINSLTAASTSTIAWTTDELSTSKVFYSTVTPLDVGASTTQSVLNNGLVTAHSISLSSLATSTVYYFKVQSTDASGNTTTSNEFNVTTLAQ